MPLGFQSMNQGVIAFGFFNIDTDLLLLEHYFFFADQFCRHMGQLRDLDPDTPAEKTWKVYRIHRNDIGDLMGAIHGIHYSGFIGEVYKRFPFPKKEEDFRQRPEGLQNRAAIEAIMAGYAKEIAIPFRADPANRTIRIGEFQFTSEAFQELVKYVWLGGYPRWKEGTPPDYVIEMKSAIKGERGWLFDGLDFPDEP